MKNYMYKIKKGNLHDDAMAAAKATDYTNLKVVLGEMEDGETRIEAALAHAIEFYNDQVSGKAQADFWKKTITHAPKQPEMFLPVVAVAALKASMTE